MGLFEGKKGLILGVANDHSIAWYITVFNTGLANVGDIKVTDENGTLGCVASVPPFSLDAGALQSAIHHGSQTRTAHKPTRRGATAEENLPQGRFGSAMPQIIQ